MKVHMVLAMLLAAQPVLAKTAFDDTPLSIPMTDAQGQQRQLAGRLCMPRGAVGELRVVVLNHGSPADPGERPRMNLGGCGNEVSQWFLSHGLAVAYVMRRGYGPTGGNWAEDYGGCDFPDYIHGGLESARDVDATVNYITTLPQIRHDGAVVGGVSAGGWATLAYGAISHPRVMALIDFAGGRGGHHNNRPNNNCRPDRLADAAGFFAKTATTPMLWVYAENDTFFRPEIAAALYKNFSDHGGKADFHAMPSFGDEGHHLFGARGGSEVWGPLVEAYLKQQGVLNAEGKAAP